MSLLLRISLEHKHPAIRWKGEAEITFQLAQSGSAHNPSQSSYSRDLTEPIVEVTLSSMLVRYLLAYNNKISLLSQNYISTNYDKDMGRKVAG